MGEGQEKVARVPWLSFLPRTQSRGPYFLFVISFIIPLYQERVGMFEVNSLFLFVIMYSFLLFGGGGGGGGLGL